MNKGLIAKTSITIHAPRAQVWQALVTPDAIQHYMFGTQVASDWREGSPITWSGEWQGQAYQDKGQVLQFRPEHTLQYTHYSPLSGAPDLPDNYHTVTVELMSQGDQTRVTLSQDNNATEEERDHSAKNWEMVLTGLKQYVEP
ncbi:MAG: SRPBCC domain-containing protein [Anaerolineae bacterium]|nr:SRPBCC domain-containing protein [Anaerolineae bacterium]